MPGFLEDCWILIFAFEFNFTISHIKKPVENFPEHLRESLESPDEALFSTSGEVIRLRGKEK